MSLDRPSLTPDERYEASAIASARQRRNRPRHFIVFGALVFGAACIAMLAAWTSRASAEKNLDRERRVSAQVLALQAELETYREARTLNPDAARVFETDPNFFSKVEQMGVRAGLTNGLAVPKRTYSNLEAGRRAINPYTVTDPDLSTVLAWIRMVTDEIPGTFVSDLDIRPQTTGWRVEVTFSRYVR
ncbi:MAG: hypothetical protein DHS20C14_16100 [Phycisphaeraceae bacterium]|nr:MAG: hypothetical protein DHS20C14_16100 [Phycisphaeraceae bacterium]